MVYKVVHTFIFYLFNFCTEHKLFRNEYLSKHFNYIICKLIVRRTLIRPLNECDTAGTYCSYAGSNSFTNSIHGSSMDCSSVPPLYRTDMMNFLVKAAEEEDKEEDDDGDPDDYAKSPKMTSKRVYNVY